MLVSVPYRAINNFKKTYFTNFEITIENLLRMICRNLQQNAIRNISTPPKIQFIVILH